MLDLVPTLTNELGQEGLFQTTYDNLADTINYSTSSKYFKPESIVKVSQNEQMTEYYKLRDSSLIEGIKTMGTILYKDDTDLLSTLAKLNDDGTFWHDAVKEKLQCVKSRASDKLLERVMVSTLNSVIVNLKTLRSSNIIQQACWQEYLKHD